MLNLSEVFEKYDDEFLKFSRIVEPRHLRPDICAFLILSDLSIFYQDRNIVDGAEHDEIWLSADPTEIAVNATEEQIRDLIRCGVFYSDEAFKMFV
jgi:hypothetical protein